MFGLPIVQPGTLLQLIGAVTVQLVLLLVLLNAQPFLHRSDGFVAILADISLVLVFFCCMILEQDELVRCRQRLPRKLSQLNHLVGWHTQVTDVGDVLPENLQRRFQIATGPVEAMMVASTFFVLLAVGLIFVQVTHTAHASFTSPLADHPPCLSGGILDFGPGSYGGRSGRHVYATRLETRRGRGLC
jgi:hypothetical protein